MRFVCVSVSVVCTECFVMSNWLMQNHERLFVVVFTFTQFDRVAIYFRMGFAMERVYVEAHVYAAMFSFLGDAFPRNVDPNQTKAKLILSCFRAWLVGMENWWRMELNTRKLPYRLDEATFTRN